MSVCRNSVYPFAKPTTEKPPASPARVVAVGLGISLRFEDPGGTSSKNCTNLSGLRGTVLLILWRSVLTLIHETVIRTVPARSLVPAADGDSISTLRQPPAWALLTPQPLGASERKPAPETCWFAEAVVGTDTTMNST